VFFHEVEMAHYPLFEYPPYSLALAVAMHKVARARELDVLHVHYAIPHATCGWIAKEMLASEGGDVKVVTTLHGTDITLVGQEASFWSITKFAIERSDGLTAVSEHLRDETYGAFECTSCEIEVIPNFIDPAVYDRTLYPCKKAALGADDEKIVMHISNFRKVKRVDDVVRVFAAISREVKARLVFIGDGPERGLAGDLVSSMRLSDRVVFLGKLESVAELLACADLFLIPSEQESFGLVALEAQASGVPVVGTAGSGLDEVVRHGITGALHPVGDVAGMARSGVTLLTDAERWRAASLAARESAVERFAADRVVPMYEAFYRKVCG